MKTFLIAILILLPLAAFSQLGEDGKTNQVQHDESATPVRISADLKHYVLYSANIPYGEVGLKYGITYKWIGISASAAISLEWEEFSYVIGDVLFITSPNNVLYVGAGVGPYIDTWDMYESFWMDDFILEGGTFVLFGPVTLDAGIGFNFYMEEMYYKLGIGVNF
jgi:hypothetical protein